MSDLAESVKQLKWSAENDDFLRGCDEDAINTVLARLKRVERDRKKLLVALAQLVRDWESFSPLAQVPDEINNDHHWSAARNAIAQAEKE